MNVHSVLLINDDMDVGGVQRVVVNLANELATRGLKVGVGAASGGALWHDVDSKVHRFNLCADRSITGRLRLAIQLRRLIKSNRLHIIHSHQRGLTLIARISVVGTRTRVVEHVHNTFRLTPLGRLLSFRGHRLIACGSAIQRMLVDEYGRSPTKVAVIPNAVFDQSPSFSAEIRTSPSDVFKILGVGRLAEQKNPLRFVRLVELISTMVPDLKIQAEWAGDGPLYEEVAERLRAVKSCHIRLLGEVRDVASTIAGADLLLLTSRWEGLPLVLLEAMSLSRAVAAPDVGSCADIVLAGVNGILFDPQTEDRDLALLVAKSLNRKQLAAWGKAGRGLFESMGTVSASAARVVDLYEEASRDANSLCMGYVLRRPRRKH